MKQIKTDINLHNQIEKELKEFYYKVNRNISIIFSFIYIIIAFFNYFNLNNNFLALLSFLSSLILFAVFLLLRKRIIPVRHTYMITKSYILLASVNIFIKMYLLNDFFIHYNLLLLIIGMCLVNLPTSILLSLISFLLAISFFLSANIADFIVVKGLILPTILSLTMGITFHFSIRNILYQLMNYKISSQKREKEKEKVIADLQEALSEIKTLSGLLPICSACKKIRDDKGYWNKIDKYITTHSDVEFSHSICPDCVKSLYPEIDLDK